MIGRKIGAVIAALLVLASGHAADASAGTIVVGIAPLRTFVERIGGQLRRPPGANDRDVIALPEQIGAAGTFGPDIAGGFIKPFVFKKDRWVVRFIGGAQMPIGLIDGCRHCNGQIGNIVEP